MEVEKPYYIDSEGYLHWEVDGEERIRRAKEIWQKVKHADQTKQLATALEKGSLTQQQTKAIILHRTNTDTSLQAVNGFLSGVDTHFLIDTDGTIYQCASLYKYTQHVGDIKAKNLELNGKNSADYKIYTGKTYQKVSDIEKTKSYPDRYPINSDSIGIEVVAQCFNTMEKKVKVGLNYTQYNGKWQETQKEQKDSIATLINALKMIYNISNNDIYGHGEISAHRTANEGDDLYDK